MIEKLRGLKEWIGVIDGGGNREHADRQLYAMADLAILPFRDSHEDMRTVLYDLEQFPHAVALPSQWPGNALQLQVATRSIDQLLGTHRERILAPVNALSATKLLLQEQIVEHLPSPLNRACLRLARQALERLHLPVQFDFDDAPEARPALASVAG